jgi:tetratricopeptide (TPR) repeat protein
LIRQLASQREREKILLVDSERAFAEQSQNGLPGEDLFYEHVHLTFEGNYLLAHTFAEQVEKLLPEKTTASVRPAPSLADCARRLAWTDWSRHAAIMEMVARLSIPPYSGQVTHDSQLARYRSLLGGLSSATQPSGLSAARQATVAALDCSPDDSVLCAQSARLKLDAGDTAGAEADARRAVKLLPASSANWSLLGGVLAAAEKFDAAAGMYRRAFELSPQNVFALQHRAQALAKLGRRAKPSSKTSAPWPSNCATVPSGWNWDCSAKPPGTRLRRKNVFSRRWPILSTAPPALPSSRAFAMAGAGRKMRLNFLPRPFN